MNRFEWLALGLEIWTAIGLVGLAVSAVRRERRKLMQAVGSLMGVWLIYLTILLVVSYRQPETSVPFGKPVCFHALCYTVSRVEDLNGFPARNHTRLLRLTVQLVNHGKDEAQEDLKAYLRDAQRRTWTEAAAVSGNPLDGRVLPGTTVVSEPVFPVAADASGLELVLTHGRSLRHALIIGDPESLGHRLRVLGLDR
jgi:hypothetical protein